MEKLRAEWGFLGKRVEDRDVLERVGSR